MKDAMKWVDEFFTGSTGTILQPSELLKLVEDVRREMRQAAWATAMKVASDAYMEGDLVGNQMADAIATMIDGLGKPNGRRHRNDDRRAREG